MKMVKSLLLGSAAGVVAMAGAQAADLPVKAKAVEYVKICSLYGKGFYYIPGSDVCLSITGFTRFQIYAMQGGNASGPTASGPGGGTLGIGIWNLTSGPFTSLNGLNTRSMDNQDFAYRTRVMLTVDARQQTGYGTLRSVITAGYTNDVASGGTAGTSIYANRGFIQLAGFTFGKAVSFYDFYSVPAYSYYGLPASDTGDGGAMVAAFTAQFGGGVSATISAEEPRRNSILNSQIAGTAGTLTFGTNDPVNNRFPDIVGALRWDGSWGAFQLMGALHDASSGYYGTGIAGAAGNLNNGHPSDTWGWIIGAGVKFLIGADVLDTQFNYTQGATKYISTGVTPGGAYFTSNGATNVLAGNVGYGAVADGVYGVTAGGAQTGIDLTTVWSFNAAYDHRWSPALKTSIYGGYAAWRYNAEATALMCANNATLVTFSSPSTCGQNWNQWYIGSRTQWDVARGFYMGVDVLYNKLETANGGATLGGALPLIPGVPRVQGTYTVADQSAWVFTFRVHRDIVP